MNLRALIPFLSNKPPQDARPRGRGTRGWSGAAMSNILGWATAPLDINQEVYNDLTKLRARSRDLGQNNPYVARYYKLVVANVLGPNGFTLRPAIKGANNKINHARGDVLTSAWADFCNDASVDGRSNFHELSAQALVSMVRDGEAFIRIHKNPNYKYGIRLELIDAERVDIRLNEELGGGRRIHMGIEFDNIGVPLAYYIKAAQAINGVFMQGNNYARIEAAEIIHLGKIDRPGQVRFTPWVAPVMSKLKQLDGYIEAEIIAARVAASKMGFFTSAEGVESNAADLADHQEGTGADAEFFTSAEPGTFSVVPEGYSFSSFDPQHPAGNFGPMINNMLHVIAAGLNVSHAGLTGHLDKANYSSLRSGSLAERDHWRMEQTYWESNFIKAVYFAFLENGLLLGSIALPVQHIEKYKKVHFAPRGWAWVDPLKDIKAASEAIKLRVETRDAICARQGTTFQAVIEQLADEEQLIKEYLGVSVVNDASGDVETAIAVDDEDAATDETPSN